MQQVYKWFGLCVFWLSATLQASPITEGELLPVVDVEQTAQSGEIQLTENNRVFYTPWSSTQLTNKVNIIVHIAGKIEAKNLNKALINAIIDAKFPTDKYQTSVIVNYADITPGTGFFVIAQAQNNKLQFPQASIVLDGNGSVQQAWDLNLGSSAVIILQPTGEVAFFKDGQLTPEEIQQAVLTIEDLLAE